MAVGGARAGAGRKKGGQNTKTAEIARKAAEGGITPLEYMLQVLRDPIPEDADPAVKVAMVGMRFEAAKAAAPYMHPRLAAVELSGGITVSHEEALAALK